MFSVKKLESKGLERLKKDKKNYIRPIGKGHQRINKIKDDDDYVYIQVIPDTSVKNNNVTNLAKAVATMQTKLQSGFSTSGLKFAYFIELSKLLNCNKKVNVVNFYFIIPRKYKEVFIEKIRSCWKKITISLLDYSELPEFSSGDVSNKAMCEVKYRNVNALSLDVDKRSNTMLANILNILNVMEVGDRVGIFNNFTPVTQDSWISEYRDGMNKFNSQKDLSYTGSMNYVGALGKEIMTDIVSETLNGVREVFNVSKKTEYTIVDDVKKALYDSLRKPSEYTIKKKEATIVNMQCVVLIESTEGKGKAKILMNTLGQSYGCLSGDNNLVYTDISYKIKMVNYKDFKIRGVVSNKYSIEECHNFLQLPGKELLDEYKLEYIQIQETEIPLELTDEYVPNPEKLKGDAKGYIHLGTSIHRGKVVRAYMSGHDANLANLSLVVLGIQGAGKSKFFVNYVLDALNNDEAVIIPDFIVNCTLSDEIAEFVPREKQVWLDMTIEQTAQGFMFNEITNKNGDLKPLNYFDERTGIKVVKSVERQKEELAGQMSQATISFIDAINSDGANGQLSSKMRKVFASACKLVNLHPNSSLYDVRECIRDLSTRQKFIKMLPAKLKDSFKEELEALEEINELDRQTKEPIGTKYDKVQYILDRIDRLMERVEFKDMVKKRGCDNVDLVDLMDKGKAIFIRIPEDPFNSEDDKNLLVTFYISKIWLSCQLRYSMYSGKQRRVHVILDEIFQAPNCYEMLKKMLRQSRKFRCKFVFSAHSIGSIKDLRDAMDAGGCSYMILSGTDKKTFMELEKELEPFTVDEFLSLPKYHAFCIMRTQTVNAVFRVKLPDIKS